MITVDRDQQLWCSVPPWAAFTYWRDAEKTAAAWKDTPNGPAFTVGDLGRVEHGLVWLDARREDLVISGGVNVYPAEVEAALADAPGLTDIAVFGRPDERWGQRVCPPMSAMSTRTLWRHWQPNDSARRSDPRHTNA